MPNSGTPRWPLFVDGKLVFPSTRPPGWVSFEGRDQSREVPVTPEMKEAIDKAIASVPDGAPVPPIETASYKRRMLHLIEGGIEKTA